MRRRPRSAEACRQCSCWAVQRQPLMRLSRFAAAHCRRREKQRLATLSKCFKRLNAVVRGSHAHSALQPSRAAACASTRALHACELLPPS